ncbi:MAG: hypothetical protein V4617_04385 [Gemmatimonadota bacterium]
MAALRPNTESTEGTSPHTPDEPTVPAPRWVTVCAGVVLVLVLAFVVMHLAGGGFRGHRA